MLFEYGLRNPIFRRSIDQNTFQIWNKEGNSPPLGPASGILAQKGAQKGSFLRGDGGHGEKLFFLFFSFFKYFLYIINLIIIDIVFGFYV